MLDDHHARQSARIDILMRFRELSWQDQYKTYEVIQGYFIHSGPGSEALQELRDRAECVKAVQAVAKHLQLPDGRAPGAQQYEQARKELGIELSSSTIIRRWDVWREVCKAARGEKVSLTARQRAHLRAVIRTRGDNEEWLTGVREWLTTRPPATAGREDYNAWAEERNEKASHLPPLPSSQSVSCALALPWMVARKVAERDLSLVDAQAQQLDHLRKQGGGFAGVALISLLHGVTTGSGKGITRTPGFPVRAFKIGKAQEVWRLADIEAHHKNKPFPDRTPDELQDEILDRNQMRALCELTSVQLSRAIHKARLVAPPPAGRVGGCHYWWRSDVERWVAQNPQRAPGLFR